MIRFAPLFQDGMLLQCEKPIRLFGTSTTSQHLTIRLNNALLTEADIPAGSFRVELPAQPAAENATLTIDCSAEPSIVFRDVDIGEVWIAGGQSNMEFTMAQDADAADRIAAAQDEHLRFYDTAKWAFEGERAEGIKDSSNWERWMRWEPDDAGHFSAVAAWCALELRRTLGVPVGIIGCNWGGTSASTWLDRTLLEQDEALRVYCTAYEEGLKTLDLEQYEQNRINQQKFRSDPELKAKMNEYIQQAMKQGLLTQMRQALDTIGPKSENRPGALYETMVQKIAGVACRGVLWYQGETDDHRPTLYHKLFPAMIGCWRNAWQEQLPFLFVQLAPFGRWGASTGAAFPTLRAAQEQTAKTVPDCWMVSIMDTGAELDIHPTHKQPVGQRLAKMALGKIYGKDILCESPEFTTAELQPGKLMLHFAHAGEGLYLKGGPLQAMQLRVNGEETVFEAAAHGDALTLHSPAVQPDAAVEVRFAWEGWCQVNLYNSADLPAKPFCWQNVPVA